MVDSEVAVVAEVAHMAVVVIVEEAAVVVSVVVEEVAVVVSVVAEEVVVEVVVAVTMEAEDEETTTMINNFVCYVFYFSWFSVYLAKPPRSKTQVSTCESLMKDFETR